MNHAELVLDICKWVAFLFVVFLVPPLLSGVVNKTKALLQGRVGARVVQPLYDLSKLLGKGETLSATSSWIFRSTAAVNFTIIILVAVLTPWLSFKPQVLEHTVPYYGTETRVPVKIMPNGVITELPGAQVTGRVLDEYNDLDHDLFFNVNTTGSDIFLIVSMFALARLFTVLASLDAGSVFGGFGASREVTLALLVEPAIVLALASLGCAAQTSDLNIIFSWGPQNSIINFAPLWFIAGFALFLATLAEMNRMPVDDPTSRSELTMVHEAMILENSGRNLALVQFTHFLKMAVLLGLTGQSFMHGIYALWRLDHSLIPLLSLVSLFILSICIGVIESASVKLRWTKIPEFIAYSVAMSLLCVFIAIGGHR